MTRTEALDTRVNGLETELREVRNEINLKFEALMSQMAEQFSSIGQRLDNQQPTGLSTPITASSNKGKGPILVSGHQEARRNLSEELRLEEERGPMMVKKVEFPDFDGDDVLTWVTKAEQYFAIQATKPGDRVTVAMVSMTGSALNWVRWVSQHRPYFSWNDLKTELVKRFMGIDAANRFEHLSSLKQTGTVDEFVNDLIACASHTEGLGNDQMLGYFLAGLKPEIRVDLQTFEATELMCAMDGARRVERKLDFEKGKGHNFWRRPYNASTVGRKDWAQKPWTGPTQNSHSYAGRGPKEKEDHPRPTAPPTTQGTWASSRPRYARSLSNQEYRDLTNKGLCYKCRQPFTPLHRCAEQVFKLVEVEAEEIEADSGLELIQLGELGPGDGPSSTESDLQWLELPLKALGGEMSKRALKVRAKLGDRKIVALVDSGASHCFINTRIVEVEELAIESTAIFGVRLGNGSRVETRGICRALSLHFGTCKMEIDCYPFDLGGIDVILGFSWLLTMRKTLVDWEAMTIEFDDGLGQKVTIHGDPTLAVSEVSMNSLHKLGEIEYQAVVWQVEAETELRAIEKLDSAQQQELSGKDTLRRSIWPATPTPQMLPTG
ncbi:hypothetical protein V2J09_021408 [Rumex salicifolius]